MLQYFLSHSGKLNIQMHIFVKTMSHLSKMTFEKNYHRLLLGNKTNLESLIVSNSIKFQNSVFLLINLIIVIKLTI